MPDEIIPVRETILVVEDDRAVAALIATALETQNLDFQMAGTGRAALEAAARSGPALLLLDLGLPDLDGVEVIKKIRAWSMLPIIVVSARGEDEEKVAALDAGADDYLTKPFSVDELLARVRAALRRLRYERANAESAASTFDNGPLHIDYAAGSAAVNGRELHLAPMEYKLLCLLARNTGKVLTHKLILQAVWGNNLPHNLPSLRVFMATLRKKIEAAAPQCACIHTHVGVGYRMVRL